MTLDVDNADDVLWAAVAGFQPRGDRWAMARISMDGQIDVDMGLTFRQVMVELQRTASRTSLYGINWRKLGALRIPRKITPEMRWTVLQRDSFRCRYCGAAAPDATLHVDHVISVKDGGTDDLTNLVTACQDCNLGKGSRSA